MTADVTATNGDLTRLGHRLAGEVLGPMKSTFVGKDEIIDLMGVSLVAGENLFLLGPPGTAKSALVFELGRRLEGRIFEYLLTRFTEPNELFGPFDIRKREGELLTNTEGMLPSAARVPRRAAQRQRRHPQQSADGAQRADLPPGPRDSDLPTLMVIGASNRLLEDDALGSAVRSLSCASRATTSRPTRLGDAARAVETGPGDARSRGGREYR